MLLCWCVAGVLAGSAAGGPFADAVVAYNAGSNPEPGYTDAAAVLGSPTRFTGVQFGFPSVVSPFSPAFDLDEIVSVGFGGSLTVQMGRTIRDDAGHRFGLDFIVFGNAGFIDVDYPNGSVGDEPAFFESGAPVLVEASIDGVHWAQVAVQTLDLWPTLGYRDAGPFDAAPGSVRTSFLTAMDPSLTLADVAGMSYAELVGVYGRSGGGIGFDLASAGLVEATYLRFTHAGLADQTFQIDAVAVVPSPAGLPLLLGITGLWRARRNREAGA
ncbi:MAG: hypothetical protein DYG94_06665 [Leptolyngbya sp. PLA3]|nr:MAG: hypothetical protein EDM82_06010 [Cyanobacteria bacterium CYA]MCE7968411.1 hypothetical protein [Leptolyngbya sp. PL-A3]